MGREESIYQKARQQPPAHCRQAENTQCRGGCSGRQTMVGQQRYDMGDGAVDCDRHQKEHDSQ